MTRFLRWVRVGLLDLYGDVRRFGILIACLALGTAAIAAVGSVGASLNASVVREASTLLGGDLEVVRPDRDATPEELAFLDTLGTVTIVVDANARVSAGEESAFADVIAVAGNYPLIGAVTSPQLATGDKPATLLDERDGVFGALVDELIFERLGIELGGTFEMGGRIFAARGILGSLPDGAARGFHLGIPTLISIDALAALDGIRQPLPGMLTQHRYKLVLEGIDEATAAATIAAQFNDPVWLVRSPRDAAGGLVRYYDLFARYLLILGLASLLVGGVGVSIAVTTYIGERQRSIATMRSMGATGARILTHFLTQIAVLSTVGVVLGVAAGAIASMIALPMIGRALGVSLHALVDPVSLLTAAGFGYLASFAFSWLALVSARKVSPVLLFRSLGMDLPRLRVADYLAPSVLLPMAAALGGIFALAYWTTGDLRLVGGFAAGIVLAFIALRAAGTLLQILLRHLPESPITSLRHAMRNIHLPGSTAPVVVLSLGLGLAMVVVIAVLNSNLSNQLLGAVSRDAPTFVATDVFPDEVAALQEMAAADPDFASVQSSPSVRARVVSVAGTDPKTLTDVGPEAGFLLGVDIPVTWRASEPDDGQVVAGTWWPADYDGPPLVSLHDTMMAELGLEVGDEIAFDIFADRITATVANFRDYQWQNGMNFMVIFSPGEIQDYPATELASLKAAAGAEKRLERALVRAFPEIAFIPIGDALNQAVKVLTELATGINIVGGLAVLNGLLVLAGTMAAGRKQREADAVIQKVLGATRRHVLWEFVLEYGLLGVVAAVLASVLGIAAAWAITESALDVGFAIDPMLIGLVIAGAVLLTLAVGTVTTWQSLSVSPGKYLREVR